MKLGIAMNDAKAGETLSVIAPGRPTNVGRRRGPAYDIPNRPTCRACPARADRVLVFYRRDKKGVTTVLKMLWECDLHGDNVIELPPGIEVVSDRIETP